MLKRIITAFVCLTIFAPVLIFSGTPVGKIVFISLLTALAVVGVYELAGCIGVRRQWLLSIPSYIFVILMMIFVLFLPDKSWMIKTAFATAVLYIFVTFSVSMLSSGNVRMSQTAELVSVSAYIAIGFLCIILTRYATESHIDGDVRKILGNYLYMLIFLGAWSTDTGAYFVGVMMGKHKLIPGVSPNKTVEGAIGGVFGCAAGYAIYGAVLTLAYNVKVNWGMLMLLAVIIAVVDQLGDLIASYIKREQGIKDFGTIFPGHGGVLDRFDSIIAIAPVIYIFSMLARVNIFS